MIREALEFVTQVGAQRPVAERKSQPGQQFRLFRKRQGHLTTGHSVEGLGDCRALGRVECERALDIDFGGVGATQRGLLCVGQLRELFTKQLDDARLKLGSGQIVQQLRGESRGGEIRSAAAGGKRIARGLPRLWSAGHLAVPTRRQREDRRLPI